MKKTAARFAAAVLVFAIAVIGACVGDITTPQAHAATTEPVSLNAASNAPFDVSGSSIIFADTEIVHSVEPTATGLIQRSSTAGQLTGDLNGSLLFNATAVVDFVNGTVVNTGSQFFSGTVDGSGPVILHDDTFRFDIDLNTGATLGTVHFARSNDAPHKGTWFECDLIVVGNGIDGDGNLTSDWSGECIERGYPN